MKKFLFSFGCEYLDDNSNVEIFFSSNPIYNGKEIGLDELSDDNNKLLDYMYEIKQVIKKEMERIRENRIIELDNNETFMTQLNILIDTIDNGVLCDCEHGNNFLFLTDNYLCLNNFENEIKRSLLESLVEDAETYETMVIIDRNYEKFYFVRTTRNLSTKRVTTTINKFLIRGNKVINKIKKVNGYIEFNEYTEAGIQKLLYRINK